ncbi:MAG TPA: hypothetical protein DCL01_06285 [Thauera sp.]|nr:hypothetical protein [Thauera sp.]HHW64292.1 hypothetical protein [Rhodocyclaceae bacterium]
MNTRLALLAGLLGLSLTGCGGHEVVRPTVDVSIGQQLIDLKRARESGALSQREYERQRKRLIDSVE